MRRKSGLVRAMHAMAALALGVAVVAYGKAPVQDVVIGQVGPFTVLPSPDAAEINQGAQAYFDQVNDGGGVGGHMISFFKLDDKYSGDEFVAQIRAAAVRHPIALISPIGSAVMQKLVIDKELDKYDIVVLNALPGAEVFRHPGHPRLFHIRAGDGDQIGKIVQHIKTLGINRLEVMYQDVATGSSGLAIAKDYGSQLGVKVEGVQAKAIPAAQLAAAKAIAATQPEATLVLGAPRFMAEALDQLRKAGVGSSLFAISYMPPPLLVKIAGQANARGVAVTQTYPNPAGRVAQVQRDFQATMKRYAPTLATYNSFHLEGYICARVLVQALRVGGPVTAEQLAKNLRAMGLFDLGGFSVDYSKGNTGSSFVDIGIVGAEGRLIY